VPLRSATAFTRSLCVDLHAQRIEFSAQHANSEKNAYFNKRGQNADSFGDFLVGLFFDERESGDEAVFRGELEKRSPEAATQFALGGRIAPGSGGEILGKLGFLPRVAEMIQGRVGGNAAGPGAKIPRGGVETTRVPDKRAKTSPRSNPRRRSCRERCARSRRRRPSGAGEREPQRLRGRSTLAYLLLRTAPLKRGNRLVQFESKFLFECAEPGSRTEPH